MLKLKLLKTLNTRTGQALILAYVVLIFLTILAAAFLTKAVTENNLSQRHKLIQEATYLAEGAIEDAIYKFSDAIANFDIAPDEASYIVVTNYGSFYNATVNSTVLRLEDDDRIVDVGGGAAALVRNYKITSSCQHPLNNTIVVTLHQIVARQIVPAFQHAVFYEDVLEILPGINMDFSGRIHSNHDIYLGAEGGRILTVHSDYLHSAGEIYNRRKNDGTRMAGDVSIKEKIDGGYALMEIDGVYLDSDNPNWASESQSRWQGTVQSAVHGVTRLAAPQVRSIQDDGYYANEAGLKITNDTVMEGENQLVNGVHMPAGTITTTESFYNNREGKTVKMTEIDLRKLAGYDGTETPGALPNFPPHLPDNGLLYASRDDAGELFQPGIRLANGALIDKEGGLTVVTEDPLYIQGDYNTDTKKPAAVICDALNILANGWQDTDSGVGLSNAARKAQETTINTAFIAGIDTSDPETGKYNGGLENYPRLHENWSNVNLNINGAFLALWDSAIAQGEWHYGSPGSGDSWLAQYTAPRRIWNYDPIFNNPLTLPPLTPWAVQIQRVAWWKE